MFYLYGEKEFDYIFSGSNLKIEDMVFRAVEIYKGRPGFFTPYRAVSECAGELLAPFYYPVIYTVGSCAMLFSTAIAVVGSVIQLLIAFGAKAFGNTSLSTEFFKGSAELLHEAGKMLLISVVCALFAALSIPHSIASIITRSGATIAQVTTGYNDGYQEPVLKHEDVDEDRSIYLSTAYR